MLKNLLDMMDVPEHRKGDFQWLIRNLGIRNSQHPYFEAVMNQLKKELKK